MEGWKTWLGGLAAVGVGVAGVIWGFFENQFAISLVMGGFAAMGISVIGLGHKLDKNTKAIHTPEG